MDPWQWAVIATAALLLLAASGGLWKRWPRHAFTIDHIRVELHPAHIVDDRVIEAVWRAAISMTNTSRRPRMLPMLAERATVRSGTRWYLAFVYLDAGVREINPGDMVLAWCEWVLPASRSPQVAEAQVVRAEDSLKLRFACQTGERGYRFTEVAERAKGDGAQPHCAH